MLWVGATRAADCPVCPELVTIPAGEFAFGSAADEEFRGRDELLQAPVEIPAQFAVSKYEITRAQYAAFAKATKRRASGDCLTDRRKLGDWRYDRRTNYRDPGFAQGDDHPVACVSFDDAIAYVDWLNTRTGGGYRLLTEIEWEYVAGTGSTARYPWGGGAERGCEFANGFDLTLWEKYSGMDTTGYEYFDPLPCSDGWRNTSPVGSLAPNAFGVHDMIGNVSEWVSDCHTSAALRACEKRVAKGGSWGTLAHNLRTADRFPYPPEHRDDSIGIRVARPRRATDQ
jgi:formylglycine-generating enzyme required for sulfatase activity